MGILNAVLTILGLAGSVLQSVLTGGAAHTEAIGEALLKIAQNAAAAYQQHTGEPIDPTLLKTIDKV